MSPNTFTQTQALRRCSIHFPPVPSDEEPSRTIVTTMRRGKDYHELRVAGANRKSHVFNVFDDRPNKKHLNTFTWQCRVVHEPSANKDGLVCVVRSLTVLRLCLYTGWILFLYLFATTGKCVWVFNARSSNAENRLKSEPTHILPQEQRQRGRSFLITFLSAAQRVSDDSVVSGRWLWVDVDENEAEWGKWFLLLVNSAKLVESERER